MRIKGLAARAAALSGFIERPTTVLFSKTLFALMTFVGCETVEGFGRDVGTARDVITEEAQAVP